MPEVINVKILHLVLKKKWYEMQESGEKTEEYRELSPYWRECAHLQVRELKGNRYRIDNYDGNEDVYEPEDEEYITIYIKP